VSDIIEQLQIQPLTSLFLLIGLAGCSPCGGFAVFQGACERVCCEVADKVDVCEQVTYADLDALDRDDFVRACTGGWTSTSADLTSYELQEATESCRAVRDKVKALDFTATDEGCAALAGLAALYADTDTPDTDE
jgi:hypothetical protein